MEARDVQSDRSNVLTDAKAAPAPASANGAGPPQMQPSHPLWTLVLAAGAGRRLASVTGGIPKQFWRARGTTSLLEDTLARTAPLTPRTHTLVVVDRTHAPYVDAIDAPDRLGHVLYQPADRGTAVGVLFGLIPVLEAARDDVVLILPSDHGILEPRRFQQSVLATVGDVLSGAADIVLFGVQPTDPDSGYGWIRPGGPATTGADGHLLAVADFVEKPPAEAATRLFTAGAVWNTMVLVARPSTLLDLYRRHAPEVCHVFERAMAQPPVARTAFLEHHYAHLPPSDFSRDVLARATRLALRTWPAAMGWSDLGTPDRLERWLQRADAHARAASTTTATEPAA
jgi:mannose-1-phosphate guanylyltransferase